MNQVKVDVDAPMKSKVGSVKTENLSCVKVRSLIREVCIR